MERQPETAPCVDREEERAGRQPEEGNGRVRSPRGRPIDRPSGRREPPRRRREDGSIIARKARCDTGARRSSTERTAQRVRARADAAGAGVPFGTVLTMPTAETERDPRIVSLPASEIRRRFVEFFAERGHAVVPSASLVPAGDQTLLFTNSGMVQFKEVLTGAETRSYKRAVDYQRVPARRRQAQRLRGSRPDDPPPHVLRDARQLELRRLLQARGDPLRLGLPDPRPGHPAPSGSPRRPTRTTRSPGRSGATRSACRRSGWRSGATSTPATTTTSGGWPTPGRAGRAARSTSTAAPTCPKARVHPRPLRELPALARDLEPRVHGVRPAPDRAGPAAVPERRHGDGPRAAGERPPAGPEQLRHRPVHADPRPDARAPRPRPRRVRGRAVQLPGHRRPCAGDHVPHRRRRAAVERGARLRPAPDRPPRGPPRPAPRPARAVPRDAGHGRRRDHGRRLPVPPRARGRRSSRRSSARRRSSPGRSTRAPATSRRPWPGCTTAERIVGRRADDLPSDAPGARRRRRVPAPRHVRLPDRPDDRAGRRVRRPRRPRRVRGRPRRAARAEPRRAQGRAREARRTDGALRVDPPPRRRRRSSSATRRRRRTAGSSRSSARASSTRS